MGRQTQEHAQQQKRDERRQQALDCKKKHKLQDAPSVLAPCMLMGNKYGVGIGLYFQTIAWIRWLFFWLALCMVPYAVVINSARFTTEEFKGDAKNPGVAMQPTFNILQSLTFAVMPDTEVDQGLLSWMNIQLPGSQGITTMSRNFFLVWISMMDAGSMAVFSVACLLLYKLASRFTKAVDESTKEVADYTVVVRGLPETTPIDIGRHFSKGKRVERGKDGEKVVKQENRRIVDVVLIKDFGPLLNLAATATKLEEERKAADTGKVLTGKKAEKHKKKMDKMQANMGKFLNQASKKVEGSGFDLKAVFVTFDKESDAEKCLAESPKGWLGSFLQRKSDRFLGKHRYWVEPATPPENIVYENLSVSRTSQFLRMSIVRIVVFCILLASAGAVTKLMATNMSAGTGVPWDTKAMSAGLSDVRQSHPLNFTDFTEFQKAALALNATRARYVAAGLDADGDDGLDHYNSIEHEHSGETDTQLAGPPPGSGGDGPYPPDAVPPPPTYNETSSLLPFNITDMEGELSSEMFKMISDAMFDYATGGDNMYCSYQLENTCGAGFSKLLDSNITMKAAAGVSWPLVDSLLKREALLKQLPACSATESDCYNLAMCQPCHCKMLSLMTKAKKGDKDWARAMQQECGGYMLPLDTNAAAIKGVISFVIVILNFLLKVVLHWLIEIEKHFTQSDKERAYAVSAFVSQLLNSVLVLLLVNARSDEASNAINAGLASGGDNQVGQSLQLLIIINSLVTAWIGMPFVLDSRVADLLLGIWIVMMFGSGIPSLYIWGLIWLVVVELSERWSLARVCQLPARYGKSLPFLLLSVLPWAVGMHCALGLWMHTRFNAGHVGGAEISSLTGSVGIHVGGDINTGVGGNQTSILAGSTDAYLAESLSGTPSFSRILQANGLPLLVLLILHLALHGFIKFMLYFFAAAFMAIFKRVFACCFKKGGEAEEEEEPEVTFTEALQAREAQAGKPNAGDNEQSNALSGVPTYRLPHHPRYSEVFSNPMYKPIWFKAFGTLRYTTLLSRPGGGFLIAPQHILAHDQADMEQSLSSMSEELKNILLKMADDNEAESSGKIKRHTELKASEVDLLRQESRTIEVAVLAGLGFESPRTSSGGSNSSASPFAPPLPSHISTAEPGATAGTQPADDGGSFSLLPQAATPGLSRFAAGAAAGAAAASGVTEQEQDADCVRQGAQLPSMADADTAHAPAVSVQPQG